MLRKTPLIICSAHQLWSWKTLMIYSILPQDISTSMSHLNSMVAISRRVSRTSQWWLEIKYIGSKRSKFRHRKWRLRPYTMKFKIWPGLTVKAKTNMQNFSTNTGWKSKRSVRRGSECERTIRPWSNALKATLITCKKSCNETTKQQNSIPITKTCSLQFLMPKSKSLRVALTNTLRLQSKPNQYSESHASARCTTIRSKG